MLLECDPGESSCHIVCGVFISMVQEGDISRIKDTDITISAQRCFGIAASIMIDLTRSRRDLLNLLETEFCLGVSAGSLSKDIPLSEIYELNSFDTYSPPRSDLRILICLPWNLSDLLRNFTKHEKTWDFDLIIEMLFYFVASSMKDSIYFDPPVDATGIGPTASLWIQKRGVSHTVKWDEKGIQWAFAIAHASHHLVLFDTGATFARNLWFKWPNHWCQMSSGMDAGESEYNVVQTALTLYNPFAPFPPIT